MRVNTARNVKTIYTAEGAKAKHINAEAQLRRSVLSCLLWESEFYEDGQDIAARIIDLANHVSPQIVADLAREARHEHGLRHVPLLLLLNLVGRPGSNAAAAINTTIKRADEMTELLALYWKDGRKPLAKQLQRGLAAAFVRFNEYALAKYNREGPVKMRDVMFLSHAKPTGDDQEALFKRVAANELAVPDTWEVNLSGGGDKKETFTRMLRENKLGYLALLRNLRNMVEAGVDLDLVKAAIVARKGADMVFPFRYVAAARVVPMLEPVLDQALCEAVAVGPRLTGKTVVLVDVSGSMNERMSAKSDLTRLDAAATLASVIHGDVRMFSFSDNLVEVPPRTGMAGVDAIVRSQPRGGTRLFDAVHTLNSSVKYDRLIVITDEQATGTTRFGLYGGIQDSRSTLPDPMGIGYMINVASAKNGVGYGAWRHIDGFSEAVIRFMIEIEASDRR